jgi:type VI secretion system protein ImpB
VAKSDRKRDSERVDLFIEIEDKGSKRKVRLPFVQTILSDVGASEEAMGELKDREAVEVTSASLDRVIEKLGVAIEVDVPGTDGQLTRERIQIRSMRDFDPDRLAGQLSTTKPLLELRESVNKLLNDLATGVINEKTLLRELESLLEEAAGKATATTTEGGGA